MFQSNGCKNLEPIIYSRDVQICQRTNSSYPYHSILIMGVMSPIFCVIMLHHVYTQELAQPFETVKKEKFGGKKRSLKEETIFTKLHTTGHPCIWGLWLHLWGNLSVTSDQWPDPLSHTTPSTSSNKSWSLGTPMADPCCWGQLQEIGLSGPTPTWPGSVKTRRRSTWFKLLPKTCWQG